MTYTINHKELLDVSLGITHKDGKPQLEIRKRITDPHLIKQIITCAFKSTPTIIQPTFNKKFHAINSLIKIGVIHPITDTEGNINYEFLI